MTSMNEVNIAGFVTSRDVVLHVETNFTAVVDPEYLGFTTI